jgi:hypothetical protein
MKSESDETFNLTTAFEAEWKNLGKKLGVTRDDLDAIEKATGDIEKATEDIRNNIEEPAVTRKNIKRLELVWGKWLNAPNPRYPPTWIGLCKLLSDRDYSKYLNL